MGLSPTAILDIIELVYFVPVLPIALYVAYKHGFSRRSGWVFLVILSLVRIAGTATGIAASLNPSQGLIQASYILLTFGITFLLFASLGLLDRVGQCMEGRGCPPKVAAFVIIPILIGLILSIIGSTDLFKSSPSSQATGYTYLKAGTMLFLLALVLVAFIALYNLNNLRYVRRGERRLLFAVTASLPLLLVRVIYSILSAFVENSQTFSAFSNNTAAVIVHAIMAVLPEFIIVAILLIAGFTVQVNPRELQERMPAPQMQNSTSYPPTYPADA